MCEFKSVIVLRPQEGHRATILHQPGVDSHSELERIYNVRERSSASAQDQFFAKVEFTPDFSDIANVSKWNLHLDEEREPDWWKDAKAKVREDLESIARDMIVTADRELGVGDWLVCGKARVTLRLVGTDKARVWGREEAVIDASARDSATATLEAGDSATATLKAWGSATATLEAWDSATATLEAWDSATATLKAWGSATATLEAWDSATATLKAWDSATATLEAWGSATATLEAGGSATATAVGITDDALMCWRYYDAPASRYRLSVAYVGEGGIEKGKPYRCELGVWTEVKAPAAA
jgi:hypothetical protein